MLRAVETGSGIRMVARLLFVVLLASLGAGCKKAATEADEGGAVIATAGTVARASQLAYEHVFAIEMPRAAIGARMDAVRAACMDARFGACNVLELSQGRFGGASGSLIVRVAPAGVQPLVDLAVEGGELRSRRMTAEDLAQAVADNTTRTDLARRTQAKLSALLDQDLPASDLIALTEKIAAIDQELQTLANEAATQRNRIETNRVSIEWTDEAGLEAESSVSLVSLWDTFTASLEDGLEGAAEFSGLALPIVVPIFVLALLWRFAWRRVTGRRSA